MACTLPEQIVYCYLPAAVSATAARSAVSIAGALGRVAVGAVDWPVIARLEGHLSGLPALGAYGGEHLPSTAAVTIATGCVAAALRLSGCSAFGASAWLVSVALLGVELLFACRKGELGAAVAACECLVLHVDHADSYQLLLGTIRQRNHN